MSSSPEPRAPLPRTGYAALSAAAMLLGLVVHLHGSALGGAARDFVGDLFWSLMIAAILSVVSPQISLRNRCIAAIGVCFLVEGSQLIHTPQFDQLRSTFAGHLVFGSGFDPRDLIAYACGILLFAVIERRSRSETPAFSNPPR